MKKVINYLLLALIVVLSIITVFPFIYMILTGLMTYAEATSIPPTLIPKSLQFQNYFEVFQRAPFLRYFANTLFVSLFTTAATVITSLLAAFALTSLEFKYKKVVTMVMVSLLMVPYESIIFTNYQTIAQLGLLDTYLALILPFLTSIFYIYYLNGYLRGIPRF